MAFEWEWQISMFILTIRLFVAPMLINSLGRAYDVLRPQRGCVKGLKAQRGCLSFCGEQLTVKFLLMITLSRGVSH